MAIFMVEGANAATLAPMPPGVIVFSLSFAFTSATPGLKHKLSYNLISENISPSANTR
jgi:hypothetical protein